MFANNLWMFGSYLLIILATFAVLIGRAPPAARNPGLLGACAVFIVMTGGYYVVYLTTPHELEWHLETSVLRLITQLWPLALLIYFLAVATLPEAAAGG